MPIFDHFGFLAPYYEIFIPLREPEQLIRLVKPPEGGTLLDAGGGTGRVAQAFARFGRPVVVADLSFKMLQEAHGKKGLASVNSHTEALPFADETFDRIIMVDALHHVCSHIETAAELWRVLKPGGRVVIEEPDVRTLAVKVVALAEKLALMRSHFISPPRIAALFSYPGAQTSIQKQSYNAWVLVDKHAG